MNGGKFANNSGKWLEAFVAQHLDQRDYRLVKRSEFDQERTLKDPIYTTQYEVGESIYGKRRRVDLILYHPVLHPSCLCIQCKWQSSGGSVEEKYPYEVESIAQGGYDTIIILDGGGYTPGARQWLVDQAGRRRLKYVFDQGEFSRFVSKGGV